MTLLIDIGNSQIKWLLYEGERLSPLSRCCYQQGLSFDKCFNDIVTSPDQIYFISVVSDTINEALTQHCRMRWGVEATRLVTGKVCSGVVNGYEQPDCLGVDRWAAMVGAYTRYHLAVAVFDFGTATTLDVLDSHGLHRGGAIIPGLDMMRQSLVSGTTQITDFKVSHRAMELGQTTTGCIEFGAIEASAAFVERMLAHAKQLVVEPVKAVITGGAGGELVELISSDVSYDEELVFWGMLEMLKSYRDGERS